MEVDGREWHRDRERRDSRRRDEKEHHGSGRRDREREKEKDKDDRRREKDDGNHRDRERERERDKDKDSKHRDRDKEAEQRERDKERERRDRDKERSRNRDKDKDRAERGDREREDREREKSRGKVRGEDDVDLSKGNEGDHKPRGDALGEAEQQPATAELRDRIARAKEERLKDKKEGGILDSDDGASEILSWVGKSRKLDEKRQAEKEKALRLARALEEQDNILADNGDDDDEEEEDKQVGDHLSGVKVLHGLDKVLEGGAVVMTLKDQSILADGDINEEADTLENIEIGEQKQRDEAYKASKKKGTYDDKFNEDSSSKKSMLSHYDDPMEDEGVTLDEGGRFTGEAEKKLEELRKRIEGGHVQKKTEDLTSTSKVSTDYFTPDEMLQFKKPKKKKSLRKKEKLDLDALEAEAIASGLGAADRGSRNDARRQSAREEEQKADAEKRSSAYEAAIAKAEEASRALRPEKITPSKPAEEEELVFGDDYEDLQKSLEQARKLALRKQEEAAGPLAVVELATATKVQEDTDATEGDSQQNKVVITEMEEFVWGLQLNQETRKPEEDDVYMDEDDDAMPSDNLVKDETNGLAAMEEDAHAEKPVKVEEEEVKPDEVIHEVAVGKGLAGALKILKERGSLNEGTDWGGRTTDKKKSKLVGVEDGPKDIRIERMDEFGRVMTPKEAFRDLSHKFHGKGPGKMKQEKRQKKYQDEMKAKRMKSSDTPLMAAEKMREAQARNQTPYLILSGNAKTSQASDASGFATVEKEHPGSLTPMLGDKKAWSRFLFETPTATAPDANTTCRGYPQYTENIKPSPFLYGTVW
ncbi:SART-1 family protein DOT2 [Panicum miliaceum]|uniref:SART-1 family protein DOT2 n=1 Tax=Panicum miliaceum TaxID=4540 RepID=A0A3L6Q500_PANMI|nr:SART-1 family protein DOT2 [Panicum miliaceum]